VFEIAQSPDVSSRARILHVITALSVGGAEMMLLRLLSATGSRYCQAVLSLKDEGMIGPRVTELGIPVYCLRLTGLASNYLRAVSVLPAIRRFRPDLAVGWMYHGNVTASLLSRVVGRPPVIWGIHHSVSSLANEPRRTEYLIRLGARLSRRADRIIYVSQASRRQHEALSYNPSAGVVIPNGIDDEMFAPDEDARRGVRTELGVAPDAILVGLVARYHPMKDHAGFLRAAARVLAAEPSVRVVLIGRGTQDQPEIVKQIAELGIQDRVLLLGERTDIPHLTAALDIACSASAWGESCSIALGEAMASGVPCVTTDVGDNAGLVGDTGLSVPPRQPETLAQAILQLVSAGPARRQQLATSARLRIREHYSLSSVVKRYEDVYWECLRGNKRS
jgi:glycosyltransferase involved in cell wall biosynthesis